MEPDKNTPEAKESEAPQQAADTEQRAPADALSRTPDDLDQEQAAKDAADPDAHKDANPDDIKISPVKRFFRKVNLYFLIFMLLLVVAGVTTIVNYLNSQKEQPVPNIATQPLTQDALKQLANTDATVGNAAQTLTIQGNAVIAGQTLMRGNLNVAGNIQTGGSIQGPNLTISGTSNLGTAQINSLQVAQTTALQGTTTMRDLNVSGAANFGGALTASQITVTKLILANNGSLQIQNHLSFSGTTPGRSYIGSGILGSGGSASVAGSDTSGTLNLNSGNNPSGSGCIIKVTFRTPYDGQPRVIISPVGSAAGSMQYYVNRDTSGFTLCTNNTPAANSVFAFDYFVTG
jgi:cytoskeletal protein CcmA (bactofilin family)